MREIEDCYVLHNLRSPVSINLRYICTLTYRKLALTLAFINDV